MRIGCTTCGAIEFKNLLMMAMVREFPELRVAGKQFSALHAHCLLRSLAGLDSASDAVRELLYLSWSGLGGDAAIPQMRQILQSTRAGIMLERMIAHEHARDVARAEHALRNDPEQVKINREKKKIERQKRHEERKKHFRERWIAMLAEKSRTS